LRLEVCIPLRGHEIDENINSIDALNFRRKIKPAPNCVCIRFFTRGGGDINDYLQIIKNLEIQHHQAIVYSAVVVYMWKAK
jgi:hypothetical protein